MQEAMSASLFSSSRGAEFFSKPGWCLDEGHVWPRDKYNHKLFQIALAFIYSIEIFKIPFCVFFKVRDGDQISDALQMILKKKGSATLICS